MDVLESVFLIASLVGVVLTLLLTIVASVRSRKTPDSR